MMFFDSINKSVTLSFDSWATDRKTNLTQLKYYVHIGSAQNVYSTKYLIVAHQTARIGVPHKTNNIALFDNLNFGKKLVNIDGVRYPRDCVAIDYALND